MLLICAQWAVLQAIAVGTGRQTGAIGAQESITVLALWRCKSTA